MAKKSIRTSKTSKVVRSAKRRKVAELVPVKVEPAKPTTFEHIIQGITPLLKGREIPSLSAARVTALSKTAKLHVTDLRTLVAAHKTAEKLNLPVEALFALGRDGKVPQVKELAQMAPTEIRAKLELAAKEGLVSSSVIDSFNTFKPILEQLQIEHAPLRKISDQLSLNIPPAITTFLAEKRISTLEDIVRSGGLANQNYLKPDDPKLKVLDAIANLTLVSTDLPVNKLLVDNGYFHLLDIADETPKRFATRMEGSLDSGLSTRLHTVASVQARMLSNEVTANKIETQFGLGLAGNRPLDKVLPPLCGCDDCHQAISPLAYLADLLNYAMRHVRFNRNAITLADLEGKFHQPFRNLPTNCEALQRQIPQARIAIEILRAVHLAAGTPRFYLEDVYDLLLKQNGTSFDELRNVAFSRDKAVRLAYANKLGITLHAPSPNDEIDQLFLRPGQFAESDLEYLFGLRNTNRPPEDPDQEGQLLELRMHHLRDLWYLEDWSNGNLPKEPRIFVDPDLVLLNDSKGVGSPSHKFWVDRYNQVNTRMTKLTDLRLDPAIGLDKLLRDGQFGLGTAPGMMDGPGIQEVLDLFHDFHQGKDISNSLVQLKLDIDAFDHLGSILQLYNDGKPISDEEWESFNSILLQRAKKNLWYPIWQKEEYNAALVLSQDFFVLNSGSVAENSLPWQHVVPWRSTAEERIAWESTLHSRIKQQESLYSNMQQALRTTEEAYLAKLRDSFFQPKDEKDLSRKFLINFGAGACQMTTRVAQAIETIQGILFGARNGLLDDNSITLDADHFDEEWKWIGSYATWRAAMLVFLYPENTLRPTLRQFQSPAFIELVEYMRNNIPLELDPLRTELDKYQTYFEDVCNLVSDACVLGPSLSDNTTKNLTYLIAHSSKSGRYYFSYVDETLPITQFESQSYWTEVPKLAEADRVIGASCYRRAGETAGFLYVFAQFYRDGQHSIAFTRRRLAPGFGWEQIVPLELPNQATDFHIAFVKSTKLQDPPLLDIWLKANEGYVRSLNKLGLGWETSGFQYISPEGTWSHIGYHDPYFNGVDFKCTTKQNTNVKFSLSGDIDNDGIDELIIAPATSGTEGNDLWIMKLAADRKSWYHFSPIAGHSFDADLSFSDSPYAVKFAVMGDFDGDGKKEIAARIDTPQILGFHSNLFWVAKFNNSGWEKLGSPSPAYTGLGLTPPGINNNEIAFYLDANLFAAGFAVVGDFDGDNRDEIAIALVNKTVQGVQYYANILLIMDLGNDGSWHRLPDLQWTSNNDWFANFAVTGDFNGDGRDEIAIARKYDNDIGGKTDLTSANDLLIWRLNENGSWGELNFLNSSTQQVAARFAVVGKFDHTDRDMIAVAKDLTDAEFWVAKMGSNGLWSNLPEIKGLGSRATMFPITAISGDFDGDGYDEIAITRPSSTSNSPDFWIEDWDPNKAQKGESPWALREDLQLNASHGYAQAFTGIVAGRFHRSDQNNVQLAISTYSNYFWAVTFDTIQDSGQGGPCSLANLIPKYAGPYSIRTPASTRERLEISRNSEYAYVANRLNRRTNLAYIEEVFYFVRMEVGLRLKESGLHTTALDWFRSVYDYELPPAKNQPSYQLVQDAGQPDFSRTLGTWLLDPLNPHAIAQVRKGSYTKFTLLTIINCLLAEADAEFARATSESVSRARELYLKALQLSDGSELNQHTDKCLDLIGKLSIKIGDDEDIWVLDQIKQGLRRINDYSVLASAVKQIQPVLASKASPVQKLNRAQKVITKLSMDQPRFATLDQVISADARLRRNAVSAVLTNKNTLNAITMLGDSDGIFMGVDLGHWEQVSASELTACIPLNRAIQVARDHAMLNLHKIDTCRNIAGMEMQLEPYAGMSAMMTGSGDQLPSPDMTSFQPLPYRYATLIERARQLVDLARQIEASMLGFLEKADFGRFEELKARQDLGLARAGLRLKDLQLAEANDSAVLANLQRDRAAIQKNEYDRLLKQDISTLEYASLALLGNAVILHSGAAVGSLGAGIYTAILTYYTGNPSGYATAAEQLSSAQNSAASMFSTMASITSALATYERRRQEWQYELALASQDVSIGQQQIVLANDRVNIAGQERAISNLQVNNAQAVIDFLANKFLNADLYDWMSSVNEQVYRFFLQQATSIAKVAQQQLAFERQEAVQTFIKVDYWERPKDGMSPDVNASGTSGELTSLKGLTGSARLLRDIYELDQYAFRTNQRKLQLTETISLAQHDPFAFQHFRDTGVLHFDIPQELFDRKFPGHYLRLIKRVRTSVIALIPPVIGIRATLSTRGTSRTVIGHDTFQEAVIQRGPESVALTSPINATGLFELDAQPELIPPFEGIGVDSAWEFRMPKAANQFDYNTIADILLTIEYTALDSYDYRQQVIKKLGANRGFSADRSFSFRNEFADAWYDLNNPDLVEPPAVAMKVSVETFREDFPPNLEDLQVQQVIVYFVQNEGKSVKVTMDGFSFTPPATDLVPNPNSIDFGSADSDDRGVISTRQNKWMNISQAQVAGTWTFSLPNDPALKNRFIEHKIYQKGDIKDILFVITYSGQTLMWPV